MTVPLHSDPEVLEKLYERFPYLSGQPLTLRGSGGNAPCIDALKTDELLAFVLASDHKLPYPPDFPFLTPDENRGLSRYVQLQPLEPWPQPLVNVVWGNQGAGVVSSVERVDVLMNPIGYSQLWYGGETGVLWEAYFERPVRARPGHDTLLHRLWELCEEYLAAKGVRFIHTYSRDITFNEVWYADLLRARGYVQDTAREHLPAGLLAVVKDLDAFYGGHSSSRHR